MYFLIGLDIQTNPMEGNEQIRRLGQQEKEFLAKEELLSTKEYQSQVAVNRYARKKAEKKPQTALTVFNKGDNVKIQAEDEIGIVYTGPDAKGNYRVQVKGEKRTYNHKRLKLYIRAEELYPEDYDFDIIFKSKEYRKLDKQMGKKYVEGLTLEDEE